MCGESLSKGGYQLGQIDEDMNAAFYLSFVLKY